MGEPVRVALIGCSGLLGEIIGQAVAAQPDVDVVADLAEPTDGASLADVGADIVLWNNAEGSPPLSGVRVPLHGCLAVAVGFGESGSC